MERGHRGAVEEVALQPGQAYPGSDPTCEWEPVPLEMASRGGRLPGCPSCTCSGVGAEPQEKNWGP